MATFMLKHHLSQISKKNLQDLLKSYREGLHENETHSCMIDLVDINKIVHEYSNPLSKNYKAQITGFRIYFIRGGNSKFIKKSKNGKIGRAHV